MTTHYDGEKLERILNPSTSTTETHETEPCSDLPEFEAPPTPSYSERCEEIRRKSNRDMNIFYGAWAVWAFGGDAMDKFKEWWKK